MADTIAELVSELKVLRKQVDLYKTRYVRFSNLERLEEKLAEMDARIKTLEKKK